MLREITIKHDRMISTPAHVASIEDYEGEEIVVDDNVKQIANAHKKEWRFKSHVNLSTQRKQERLWEIKRLINKIVN